MSAVYTHVYCCDSASDNSFFNKQKVKEGHCSNLYCGTEPYELPLILADRESDIGRLALKDLTRKVHILQLEVKWNTLWIQHCAPKGVYSNIEDTIDAFY